MATRFNCLDSTTQNYEFNVYLPHVEAEIADFNAQFASYSSLIDVSQPDQGAHLERDPSPNYVSSEWPLFLLQGLPCPLQMKCSFV